MAEDRHFKCIFQVPHRHGSARDVGGVPRLARPTIRCWQKELVGPAGAQSLEPPLRYPGETRSRRWRCPHPIPSEARPAGGPIRTPRIRDGATRSANRVRKRV